MKLLLTRHGETVENSTGIYQGHADGNLSKVGIEQAKKLALRLKDEKIDFIYASDLGRALHTAEEIRKFYENTKFIVTKELRERSMGDLVGKNVSDYPQYKESVVEIDVRPPNGESIRDLFLRAKEFLDKILLAHSNDSVLFVCHGAIKRCFIIEIMGKKADDFHSTEKVKNTSLTILEISEDKRHKIHLFNDTSHLN